MVGPAVLQASVDTKCWLLTPALVAVLETVWAR